MICIIGLALVATAQATVIYSNQAYPYVPLRLSTGDICYPSRIIDHTFPIPQHCVEWSDGCTTCKVTNQVVVSGGCTQVNQCQFTKCLPVCTKWASHIYMPPEHCMHWQDGCGGYCDVGLQRTQYISSINGASFIRPIHNMLQSPCNYAGNCAMGRCLRTRQCLLGQSLHVEAINLYKTYDPLYKALGYSSHYVPTYLTNHAVQSTSTAVSAHSPIQTVTTHSDPIGTVTMGSQYYAPKTSVVLTNDLRNTYAGLLSHQRQYLTAHEDMLKNNMHMTNINILDHNNADIDSYYYHIEQQKNMIDDLHYRVTSSDSLGYYYNPYYQYGHYPQYHPGYGVGGYAVSDWNVPTASVSQVVVDRSYPHPHSDQSVSTSSSDDEDELSSGAIAGIVIGSVAGFLLIVFLLCIAFNSMRSRRMDYPPNYGMGHHMPPPGFNTSQSDVTGQMSDAPDILDYSGKQKMTPGGKM